MTDKTVVSEDVAHEVASKVLCQDESRLHTFLQTYLQSSEVATKEFELDYFEYDEHHNHAVMHRLAFSLLNNVLQLYLENPSPFDHCPTLSSQFWKLICQSLLRDVQMAEDRPHDAAAAARVLSLIAQLTGESYSHTYSILIRHAYQYGKRHHSQLEYECGHLLSQTGAVH
jgi:hypothetical protein